jgi:DNA-binding transcriptional LysR family regulator
MAIMTESAYKLDLNLLRPLRLLLEERHVSQAAELHGISQPAMSRILDRLRTVFADELLVRTGRRYERTPRAELLLAELNELLDRLDATVAGDRFMPERCEATFRIATTDYASLMFVPYVLRDLEVAAPRCSLEVSAWDDRVFDDIAAGRLDAAIINANDAPARLDSEKIFEDRYTCVVAANHELRGRRVDLNKYLAYRHAVLDVKGGLQPAVDQTLAALGVRRTIGYRTPFLGSAIAAVGRTSMIATLPVRIVENLTDASAVRAIPAPRELPPFAYSLVWHKRLAASAAHMWFRDIVRSAAAALDAS